MRLRLLLSAFVAATMLGAAPAVIAGDCTGLPAHSAIPVVDAANVIPPEPEVRLAADLMAFNILNRQAVVAVTVPHLGGDDVSSYTHRLFDCWGVGSATSDNGVLVLVAMRERRVRIELGAGLEGQVSGAELDAAIASMVPPLRAGQVAAALRAGADAVVRRLGGAIADVGSLVPTAAPADGDVTDITIPRFPGFPDTPFEGTPFRAPGTNPASWLFRLVPMGMVGIVILTFVRAIARGGGGGGTAQAWRGAFGSRPLASSGMFFRGGWGDHNPGWPSGSGSDDGGGHGLSGQPGTGSGFGGGSGSGTGASGSW